MAGRALYPRSAPSDALERTAGLGPVYVWIVYFHNPLRSRQVFESEFPVQRVSVFCSKHHAAEALQLWMLNYLLN